MPRRHWGDPPLRLDRRPRRLRSYYIYSDEDLSFGEEEYDDEDEELDHVSRRRAGPKELVGYSGKRERRVHHHRPDRFVLFLFF